jgi:Ala-tRNA(Pro) deacylase
MGMAMKLSEYLQSHPVQYELVKHPHSASSLQSAATTQLPAGCVVKAVVLEDEDEHFLVAVLPASRKIDLQALRSSTGRMLHLASESEVGERFGDCELGAVPPIGQAYGIETVWDDSLVNEPEVYFEAGDHETLVHVRMGDFVRLLEGARHLSFSEPLTPAGARPLF